jgi:hypothetical protein
MGVDGWDVDQWNDQWDLDELLALGRCMDAWPTKLIGAAESLLKVKRQGRCGETAEGKRRADSS